MSTGSPPINTASVLAKSGAQKGAAVAGLKHLSQEVYRRTDIPEDRINFLAGTTAAGLHAVTKMTQGMSSVYKDASVTMAAVVTSSLLSEVDLPAPVKSLITLGTAGMIFSVQNRAKTKPQVMLILGGFYVGHTAVASAAPKIQQVIFSKSSIKEQCSEPLLSTEPLLQEQETKAAK